MYDNARVWSPTPRGSLLDILHDDDNFWALSAAAAAVTTALTSLSGWAAEHSTLKGAKSGQSEHMVTIDRSTLKTELAFIFICGCASEWGDSNMNHASKIVRRCRQQ